MSDADAAISDDDLEGDVPVEDDPVAEDPIGGSSV